MIQKNQYIFYFLLVVLIGTSSNLLAQVKPPVVEQDTSKSSRIVIDYSDIAEGIQEDSTEIRRLSGNVELRQDSVFMSCDTAKMDLANNNFIAYGNVIIQQKDSVSVFSDSLVYLGNEKKADLYKEVVLVNGKQQIFTDHLKYNLKTKVAQYFSGAVLTDGKTQLQSRVGYYYTESGLAYFKDSVTVIDPEFELRSDTLEFNTKTKVVTFLGPTRINQNDAKIYCESGFYDIENGEAEFVQNAQYLKDGQEAEADIIKYNAETKSVILTGNAQFKDGNKIATADNIRYDETNDITYLEGNAHFEDGTQVIDSETIIYDSKKKVYSTTGRSLISDPPQILEADQIDFDDTDGLGIATGNVIWKDTSAQITINCEIANYQKETGYLLATGGRPDMTSLMDNDTLFMSADTLVSMNADSTMEDSIKNLLAYKDVRIFKSDLQVICDSMLYDGRDSIFHFYDDPIIWSDTSQFKADTILMKMKDQQIDTIFLQENGFIVNSPDEQFFNQIKGRDITAFFELNEIDKLYVKGNAETVYYIQDDEQAYIAVNKAICSDMDVEFGNNQVEKIKCYPQPKANLIPMQKADHESLKLPGYNWNTKDRPRSLADLLKPKLIKVSPVSNNKEGEKNNSSDKESSETVNTKVDEENPSEESSNETKKPKVEGTKEGEKINSPKGKNKE